MLDRPGVSVRLFTHDLPHQPLDQVLSKDAVLPRRQFSHRLGDGDDRLIRFFRKFVVEFQSSMRSTIMQWRQGRSWSFSGSAMNDFPLGPNCKRPLARC
jgi:hypothetical protein